MQSSDFNIHARPAPLRAINGKGLFGAGLGGYLGYLRPDGSRGYAHPMSASAGTAKKYTCMQCEMIESKCFCEKYCCFCQSQIDVRLCHDGLYYCPPCREACDYKVSD